MSALKQEAGFTLVELLMAMTLMLVVLGATLDVFDGYVQRNQTNTRLNEAQDTARQAMERMARQLRNVASPTNTDIRSIDRGGPYDLVFQTVDPVKRRMRYCLDSSNPANARLWMQTQAFPVTATDPGLPPGTDCPGATGGSGWANRRVVAANVVNRINGHDRPVFLYNGLGADLDTAKVTGIRAKLFVDVNPGKNPRETSLASGDFLRNQNQRPLIPDFGLLQSPPNSRSFILNGSEATDPEGRTLEYYWYRGSGDVANLPSCKTDETQSGGGFTCIGRGITLNYTFPSTDKGTVQTVTLKVIDPGGLWATSAKQTPLLP